MFYVIALIFGVVYLVFSAPFALLYLHSEDLTNFYQFAFLVGGTFLMFVILVLSAERLTRPSAV